MAEEIKINIHENHVASCLCCKNLDIGYEGDFSDVTPGEGWYCHCLKFVFYGMKPDQDDLHTLHTIGAICSEFEPRSGSIINWASPLPPDTAWED